MLILIHPPPCSATCSCAGGSELSVFFTKFASYLASDVSRNIITRHLLRKSCLLCAEARQLLQRTLKHSQSSVPVTAYKSSLEKFGTHLRSITCTVSHLLLQIIARTDESVHGSCAIIPLVSELLLLAQFLQSCLGFPAVASSYKAQLKFVVPACIVSLVSCDTVPSMTLPLRFSFLLLHRCQDNLRR